MITAEQLRRRRLATSYRSDGYDAPQVDLYLDLAAETLASLEAGRPGSTDAAQMLLRELRTAAFAPRVSGAGYEQTQVDALRAGVVAALEEHTGTPPRLAGAAADAPHAAAPTSPTSATPPEPTAPARTSTAPGVPTLGAHGPLGSLGAVVGWGSPTTSGGGLGAYDLVVRLQTARTQLLGASVDRLVLRTAQGELLAVTSVEATADGVALTTTTG